MRITGVNIYGFGRWIDTKLDFQKDYQVIIGNNESGKTTLLYFIKSILFGFATKRVNEKYYRYIPRTSSQYGGEVYLENNSDNWIIRRTKEKTKDKLTIFKNGEQTTMDEYNQLIAPMDAKLFDKTNFINRNTVDRVYEMSDDELFEEILSMGAVGSSEWLDLSKQFEKNANEIYRPKGRKRELNALLSKDQELHDQMTDIKDENQEYQQLNQQISEIQKKEIQARSIFDQQQKKFSNLKDLKDKWLDYQEFKQLKDNKTVATNISNADWDSYLKIRQQQDSLNKFHNDLENQRQQYQLTATQQNSLDYFKKNQTNLNQLQSESNQLDYQRQHLNTDVGPKIDAIKQQENNLVTNNKNMRSAMTPLSGIEAAEYQKLLNQLQNLNSNQQTNKTNKYLLLGATGLGIVLFFFTHGFIKWIFLLIAILSLGYYFVKNSKNSKSNDEEKSIHDQIVSIKSKHNLENISDDDLPKVQTALNEFMDLEAKLTELKKEFNSYDAQYDQWCNDVEALVPNLDKNNLEDSFKNYFDSNRKLSEQATYNQNNLNQLTTKIAVNEKQQANNQKTINALITNYGLTTIADFNNLHKQNLQDANKQLRFKVLQDKLKPYEDKLRSFNSEDNLNQNLTAAQNKLNDDNNVVSDLKDQRATLVAQQQQLADDDAYQNVQQQIEYNNTAITDTFQKWISDVYASKLIRETLNQASANRMPNMMKRAKVFFKQITNGNYINIEFDDKNLNVITSDNQKYQVQELSRGTAVQLFMSLNLAFVLEISDLTVMPILIDDAFVDFDSVRQSNIAAIIKQMSQTTQVIYASANRNVAKLFNQEKVINL